MNFLQPKLFSTGILIISLMGIVYAQSSAVVTKTTTAPNGLKAHLEATFEHLDESEVPTGVLYDRAVPFSSIQEYDGSIDSPSATLDEWQQMYLEMLRASIIDYGFPELKELMASVPKRVEAEVIPIALLDMDYNKLRSDAFEAGLIDVVGDKIVPNALTRGAFEKSHVFTVSALKEYSYRDVIRFSLSEQMLFTNRDEQLLKLEADFDDGIGFRSIQPGDVVDVVYSQAGRYQVAVRGLYPSGEQHAAFEFEAKKLGNQPFESYAPDIYWENEVAAYDYLGVFAQYDAYIFLGDGNSSLEKPLLFVEGFDLDNTLGWPELFALISQEGLADSMAANGYDLIIMNFHTAVDYLQRNTFAMITLVEKINAEPTVNTDLVIAGASMGGLITRYGLAWMETNAMEHNTRLFVSYDAPHQGANIPLGDQYWLEFFADHNGTADQILALLDSPGAQQMLVYHHVTEPDPSVNPLRLQFLSDLAAVGSYPTDPDMRMISIANGSGAGTGGGQDCNDGTPLDPGEQIVNWNYGSFFVDVTGNVWAVPDVSPETQILEAEIDQIWPLPDYGLNVFFTGSLPYDNAPGGYRGTQGEMAAVDTDGLGDITSNCNNHNFIPTVSALDGRTSGGLPLNLFHDWNNDPNITARTPYDAVYFPSSVVNEEHVAVTAENAAFMIEQLELGAMSAELTLDENSGNGTFSYTIEFANNTGVTQNVDLWVIVAGPGGYYDEVFNRNKNFNGGVTGSKIFNYNIPGGAMTGDYSMNLYVGTYPSTIIDRDSEVYTKNPSAGASGMLLESELVLRETQLINNHPNPFNPTTMIQFAVAEATDVEIMIYNTLGQPVKQLGNAYYEAGFHGLEWNGTDDSGAKVASGVYIYRLTAGNYIETKKMLLSK